MTQDLNDKEVVGTLHREELRKTRLTAELKKWSKKRVMKSALILQKKFDFGKSVLFACIYELNCHLKSSFKSILEKEQIFSFVSYTWNVYRSNSISRNLRCPEKTLVVRLISYRDMKLELNISSYATTSDVKRYKMLIYQLF